MLAASVKIYSKEHLLANTLTHQARSQMLGHFVSKNRLYRTV